MRLIAVYIPALFSHKLKKCVKKYGFLLLSDPKGWLSVIYFF